MPAEFILIDPDSDLDPVEELIEAIETYAEKLADNITGSPFTGAEAYRERFKIEQTWKEVQALLTNAIDSKVADLVKERLSS